MPKLMGALDSGHTTVKTENSQPGLNQGQDPSSRVLLRSTRVATPIEPQTSSFMEAASGHRDFRSPGHSYTGDTLPTLTCRSGSRTLPALRFSATWGALALSGSRNCGTCDGCCSTGTEEDPEGSSPRIVGRERVLAKKARASPFSSSEAGLYSTIQPWRARRHAK